MHKQSFILQSICLSVLLMPAVVASGKPVVQPAGLQARIASIDSRHHTMMFQTTRRKWQADVPPDFTVSVKQGVSVPLSSFKTGETVVLLSVYQGFSLINVLTDRLSYAAFFHDLHFAGTLTQWQKDQNKMMLFSITNPLGRVPHIRQNRTPREDESPENWIHPEQETFIVSRQTQFWFGGKPVTMQAAQEMLIAETKLEVAVRWKNYHKVDRRPAYAIFDRQSWEAYARAELKSAKDLFRPSTPTPLIKTND